MVIKMDRIEIKCPHCGKMLVFEAYQTINVTQKPELREKVLNFELFKKACPHCEKMIPIVFDLLYVDEVNKFMIALVTESTDDLTLTLPQDVGGYCCRLVNNPDDLKEKILIFEKGLDDRLIELGKFYCAMLVLDQNKALEIEHVMLVDDDRFPLQIGFVLKDKRRFVGELTPAILNKFQEIYGTWLSQPEQGFVCIDFAWAQALIFE